MSIKNLIFMAVGAGIGAAVTYKLTKDKYEQILQEEIDSVKEVLLANKKDVESSEVVNDKDEIEKISETTPEEKTEYEKIVKENYTKYSKKEEISEAEENEDDIDFSVITKDHPYVIPPEEFGLMDDYDEIMLTYYADKVLADELDDLIDDIDGKIGFDSLNEFGKYEEDTVCVRNDILKCDYEILKDPRTYMDVIRYK